MGIQKVSKVITGSSQRNSRWRLKVSQRKKIMIKGNGKKHINQVMSADGGIIETEAWIHVSNVQAAQRPKATLGSGLDGEGALLGPIK